MKNLKKLLAAALCLALCLSLCACGKASPLVGKWTSETDMLALADEQIQMQLDSMMESYAQMGLDLKLPQLSSYVSGLTLKIDFSFTEDGLYSMAMDKELFAQELEQFKAGFTDYMQEVFYISIAAGLEMEGYQISSKQELEDLTGGSLDELFLAVMGIDMASFVSQVLDIAFAPETLAQAIDASGKYETKDEKLFTSAGEEYDIDPTVYEIYELEGDLLTIYQGTVADNGSGFSVYPLKLHRTA